MPFARILLLSLSAAGMAVAAAQLPFVLKSERDSGLIENSKDKTDQEVMGELKKLTPEDIDRLSKREITRLSESPLDAKALQNLAVLLAMRSEPEKTEELNLQLARYSLRNIGAQIVAINLLVGKGHYDEAMLRLDAVLRSDPSSQASLFSTLVKLAENKASLPAIGQTLAKEPPWRKAFMTYVSNNDPSGLLTYKLLKSMRDLGSVVQNDELRNVLAAWVKAGQFERAYFVWLDLLSDDELKSLKLIYDGQFSREARNQFFDWNFGVKDNVKIGIVRRPGSAVERSLQLDFVGFKDKFFDVSQMLRLASGVYDVSLDQMAQSFNSPGGLAWRVKCVGNSRGLGQSEIILKSMPWNRTAFSVVVPEENCDTQILRLESASTATLDTAITGQLYFDDIKMERRESADAQ